MVHRIFFDFSSIVGGFWLHFGSPGSHFQTILVVFLFFFRWVNSVFLGCCCVVVLVGCWVLGLLVCWVVGFLGDWEVGLSFGCWVVGFFGCWVDVGCWVVGLLGC